MPETPALILVAIGIASFLESLALVGLLVPGVVVLFSLSALASAAGIPIAQMLIVAAIGGFIGDLISFYLGQRFLPNALHSKKLSKYQGWIDQGHWFIKRWGWLSIIIGRFLGPLRPIIPLVAGALEMKARLFVTLSFFTCLAWAPAYLLPGYFTGELSDLWRLQPLDIRSLINYALTSMAVCAFALTIYHHMHPEKMHLRGWITKHQSERWPIAPVALLISCLILTLVFKQVYPLQIDLEFTGWAAHWLTIESMSHYMAAISNLSDHRLVYIELAMLIIWLVVIRRVSIAIISVVGALILYGLVNLLSHSLVYSDAAELWNLASFIFTGGLLATLTNSTRASQRRWPIYFAYFSISLIMMLSHLWLGHIGPSAGILVFLSTTAALAATRALWKLFNKAPRAYVAGPILLLLLVLNTVQFLTHF
ncbi:DedA family protein [Reinekea marinisedimentorum]|uniref:Undecaprenyl-diphosphatase n=1 Tax=Reinekea marinisedimentorum TaxID=230495 RepID=A0A4R3I6G4_9GAMM|nr:DedA family protein [Reinekea marinisedimentorum]TCS41684.1 undecaprenyl-diphosphatase [Reinekea marinisedimentorum]